MDLDVPLFLLALGLLLFPRQWRRISTSWLRVAADAPARVTRLAFLPVLMSLLSNRPLQILARKGGHVARG